MEGNLIANKEDNYEALNQPDCGSARAPFVLGGHRAPEGAFPFIVSFTQVGGMRDNKRVALIRMVKKIHFILHEFAFLYDF